MEFDNIDEDDLEIGENIMNLLGRVDISPEEIKKRKQEQEKELESKGFLPRNDELNETRSSLQEEVEQNPKQFIIEECLPACQELWSKNIYTFMASDHLNEGKCWIEIKFDNLSDENKDIFKQLAGDDVIKFAYHAGCVNFGVKHVGKKGQQRLLELAKQFKMQDVPKDEGQSWLTEKEFLMDYCGCYDEYDNPNYRPMAEPWEVELSDIDEHKKYMEEYDQWILSEESKPKLRKFNPNKIEKSLQEYVDEHKMIAEDGRVYLSEFHYQKHKKYLNYINNTTETKEIHQSKI